MTHGCSWVDWKDRDPRSSHSAIFDSSLNQGSGLPRMLGEMSSRNIRDLGRTWIIRAELDSYHPELWGDGGGELPLICYKRHSDVPCSTHGDYNYILPRSKPCHWGQRDVSVDKSRIALSEEPGLVSNTYMADHGHMQLQFEGSSTLCWTPQALGA